MDVGNLLCIISIEAYDAWSTLHCRRRKGIHIKLTDETSQMPKAALLPFCC